MSRPPVSVTGIRKRQGSSWVSLALAGLALLALLGNVPAEAFPGAGLSDALDPSCDTTLEPARGSTVLTASFAPLFFAPAPPSQPLPGLKPVSEVPPRRVMPSAEGSCGFFVADRADELVRAIVLAKYRPYRESLTTP